MMNNQLLVGLVLIAFGIGLAILAYMILNNRGSSGGDEAQAEDAPAADAQEVPEPQADREPPRPAAVPEAADLPQEQELEPAPDPQVERPAPQKPSAGPRIQVATLLRDEVSGALIVRIGDEEFDDPEALKASRYWTRLEYATRDLNAWIDKPEAMPAPGREREPEHAERKPSSMIEQINDILQERVEATGREELAVQLVEGPGGTARVLIGVNSYEIADVPNPEIKQLIREAVAAWEATQ